MNIAEASTALHQARVQEEAGIQVQRMAMDHAELHAEGLGKLLEGAALQPADAQHLGNSINILA